MTAPRTRRDAADSRERLVEAASALFAERGYDATTTRDVARRAGVDAALIARYFGSKTGLYVAAVSRDAAEPPADLLQPGRLAHLLERWSSRGPGPVLQSVVHPLDDDQARSVAAAALEARLVAPLTARYVAAAAPEPRLRAELAVAAVTGVALARHSGALTALTAAPADELVPLLRALLQELEDGTAR